MRRALGYRSREVLYSLKSSTQRMTNAKQLEFNKLEWSTTSLKVSDFLSTYSLPQIVKVIEGFYGDDEYSSLGADQILSLHCIKSTDKVVGRDYRGKEVNIPVHCQNKVEVRPSNLKDVYENVEELSAAFPRYVRISQGYYSALKDEEILNVGDKLHLKDFDKSKKGEEKLICVNQNGQKIELPIDCIAGFQPLTDGKEYFLAEILAKFPMPVYVQFINPPLMGKQSLSADASFFNSSLGPIYLQSSYTENIIIASTISHDGQRTVVTFPREIDIRLAVCEGMLQNTVAYAEICQALNHGMELNNLPLIDTVSAFKPRNSVREYPYKELVDPSTLPNASEVDLDFQTEVRTYQEVEKTEVSKLIPEIGVSKQEQSGKRPAVATKKPQVATRKPDVAATKPDVATRKPDVTVTKPDVGTTKPNAATTKPDITTTKPEIAIIQPEVVTTKSEITTQIPEVIGKKSEPDYVNENWAQATVQRDLERKDPPHKPQRSPNGLQRRAQGDQQENKCDSSSISSQSDDGEASNSGSSSRNEGTATKHMDISHYSVKQVSEILKELGMDRYVVRFEGEMIDGEMLMCLDNEILMTDFGLNKLHCMKLKKYLEGWRPKV